MIKSKRDKLCVKLVTLGCSKNRVDSEHILRQLVDGGIMVAPEDEKLAFGMVDVLIINTCGFIKDAKEESIAAIFDGVDAKADGYISKLYVFGCLSQRYLADLQEEIPEVDKFFGAYEIELILKELGVKYNPALETKRYITTPSHYAYLKISEGCDRNCSYCAIPSIRGKHTSIPIEKLIDEAEYLVDSGAKELIIIAQDTTYYGLDIYHQRSLTKLIEKLSEINKLQWIRLHYSYPASFPEDLLHLISSSDKMCKYMDIPLQHSSDRVLSAMRRSIDAKQTRELVEKMRRIVPGIALRTTMIVGHPGEGEEEFNDLMSFVADYRFERLGAFTYSEEEGTWGAQNLKDIIPEEIKQERYEALMELQSGISLAYNESRLNTVERVLIDSYSEESSLYIGRTSKESPGVDGEVLIKGDGVITIGNFANVKIDGADEYDLYGKVLNQI